MKISFFEEFPTAENLAKIRTLKYETKLYIAAENYQEFSKINRRVKKTKPKTETVYWPILRKEEGYWISPFSKTSALERIFSEVEGKNLEVMLDLELPLDRRMMLKNIFKYFRNRRLIKDFISEHKKVILCEFFLPEPLLYLLGLHYSGAHTLKMVYTSLFNKPREWKDNLIKKLARKSKSIGLGCIGIGILGDEKQLPPKELKRELEILRKLKAEEAVIFRLGGLNQQHINILNNFAKL